MNKLNRIVAFSSLFATSRKPFSTGTAGRKLVLHLMTCLLCIPAIGLAQTQVGSDIDGEAAYDQLRAVSLSANGSRLAAGAGQNDGTNGADSGHVRIYQWTDSQWTQMGIDIDGESTNDWSGDAASLSADGSRVAIGAKSNQGGGEYTGQVRVYQWSGSSWNQMGGDIDGATYDAFGHSVSMSSDGNRVAATSSEGGASGYGYVKVFQWSGSNWTQLGTTIEGKATSDRLQSVSLSEYGNHVALGAWGHSGRRGQARVYQWSGEAWTQLGGDIDGEASQDEFGISVSLSTDGSRLAVGGWKNDDSGANAGHMRVFEWTGAAWTQLGTDIDGDTSDSFFGGSVSLSYNGNRLAVSAVSKTGSGDYTGLVRIYQWSGSAWTQLGTDIDGEATNDAFGYKVELSSNGNRLAASADQNDGNGPQSGHARVYDLSMFNTFQINPGLNDHWYNPVTDGQGYYITVFPVLGKVNLTSFTYDTEQPPQGATANFGDPGHRWYNALGRYADDQAVMNIKVASGGLFDTPAAQAPVTRVQDGTIILTFDTCNSGTLEYDIPSIGRTGIVPIQRIVGDNIPLCEAYLAQ